MNSYTKWDPLRMVYPHLFFGYTAENKALFKDRFAEMAARAEFGGG
jgi:hypothetical protein